MCDPESDLSFLFWDLSACPLVVQCTNTTCVFHVVCCLLVTCLVLDLFGVKKRSIFFTALIAASFQDLHDADTFRPDSHNDPEPPLYCISSSAHLLCKNKSSLARLLCKNKSSIRLLCSQLHQLGESFYTSDVFYTISGDVHTMSNCVTDLLHIRYDL